jgi:microcompartment protein CcmK/EutM
MFVGKVIGTVWSTVKWPEMQGHKLLVVRPYHLAELRARQDGDLVKTSDADGPLETVVCIDLLDAGVGDDVVVAFGHAARVAAEMEKDSGASPHQPPNTPPNTPPKTPPKTPIDAAVVAVVDGYSLPRLRDRHSP